RRRGSLSHHRGAALPLTPRVLEAELGVWAVAESAGLRARGRRDDELRAGAAMNPARVAGSLPLHRIRDIQIRIRVRLQSSMLEGSAVTAHAYDRRNFLAS